jgi:hypothetical protein
LTTCSDGRELVWTVNREFVRRDTASSLAGMARKFENSSSRWVQCDSYLARLKTRPSNNLVVYKCLSINHSLGSPSDFHFAHKVVGRIRLRSFPGPCAVKTWHGGTWINLGPCLLLDN